MNTIGRRSKWFSIEGGRERGGPTVVLEKSTLDLFFVAFVELKRNDPSRFDLLDLHWCTNESEDVKASELWVFDEILDKRSAAVNEKRGGGEEVSSTDLFRVKTRSLMLNERISQISRSTGD